MLSDLIAGFPVGFIQKKEFKRTELSFRPYFFGGEICITRSAAEGDIVQVIPSRLTVNTIVNSAAGIRYDIKLKN